MSAITWPRQDLIDSNVDTSYLAYVRSVGRPLLSFTSGHFPAGARGLPHRHPCIVLHGCLCGPIVFETEHGRRTLEAGHMYLLPANELHHWECVGDDYGATIGLLIDAENPGRWPKGTGVAECCDKLNRLVDAPKLFSMASDPGLRHAFWQAADLLTTEEPCSQIIVNSTLWQLLGLAVDRLEGVEQQSDDWLDTAKRIRRVLLNHVYDSPSVESIAREVGMSLTNAKKVFSATYGCGIKEYLNQLKLYQAKRLLGDPTLTVEQVSYKLGFSSTAYFCRMFRARTGFTPTDFRRSLQLD
ncbi:AraC family transcriptional regulator [Botrimarina sp.]|uniref:helix-turn-helix domain-containing protein n=1 Tax=Botrimarina sp. TaxID=2795802 RepID=UPI0032EC29CF